MEPASPNPPLRRHSHLGAYARIERGGQLLLIRKCRGPYTGSWDLPGGTIEFGESPEEAVIREVQEETGLQVVIQSLLAVPSVCLRYQDSGGEAELHHLGMVFSCEEAGSGQLLREGGDGLDAGEARWCSLSECREMALTPFARLAAVPGAA